jgi:predicted transcriptional regulator of viral defense system
MATGAERDCNHLAAGQHGVLSHAQAIARGMSRSGIARRVRGGSWEVVLPRVYRLAGVPSIWLQSLMAASLWAGPGSAISHRAAAALHGLCGFKRTAVEVSTTANRKRAPEWLVCHRVAALPPAHVEMISGIPVTSAERTLLDLAAAMKAEDLERALDEVMRRGMASRLRIAWTLQHSRIQGRRVLQDLLDARLPGYVPPHGELEATMVRLVKKAGLPLPVREYEIRENGFSGRADFAWPDFRVAVETDGFVWHSSRHQWQRDRTKRNILTVRKWTVLQLTWEDLTQRPEEVVADLSRLLRKPQLMGQVPTESPRPRG